MLIVPESLKEQGSKSVEAGVESTSAGWTSPDAPEPPPDMPEATSTDEPPPYSPPDPSTPLIPDIPQANFVHINTSNHYYKGEIVLNPSLEVPESLRPRNAWGRTERRNLVLETSNGSMDADVYIVGDENHSDANAQRPRASIEIITRNGSAAARLHRSSASPAFNLSATTTNGGIFLRIPRSFHGPVAVSTRFGNIRFSDEVSRNSASFGNTKFVGSFAGYNKDTWTGDEAVLETRYGPIEVKYDDEKIFGGEPWSSFFSKWLPKGW